jgi:hypothetical protein
MFFSLPFVFGCFYTENPLFSLSIIKPHVFEFKSKHGGFNVWDGGNATRVDELFVKLHTRKRGG